jgi:hypothetical protein
MKVGLFEYMQQLRDVCVLKNIWVWRIVFNGRDESVRIFGRSAARVYDKYIWGNP